MRFRTAGIRIFVLLALAGLLPASAFNNPDIRWRTIETEHFIIHYYKEVEWTARKVAQVAEEIYPTVTGIYDHEPPRRTRIIVRDDEDMSNGFAVFHLGYLTVWASPSTLSLRGRHDWIRGVITHEFSHIVSLQMSSGAGYLIEGLRFGGIGNANTRLNTDVGGTVYILTNPYSRWWAEGTAQIDTAFAGYDLWDTHQDMLLRACTLEDNLLNFHEMHNITVRRHFGGELVYNQGYAFLLWLENTYGHKTNAKIARQAGNQWSFDFDNPIEDVTGKSARALYNEWHAHLRAQYENQVAGIRSQPREGRKVDLVDPQSLAVGDPRDRPYKDGDFNFYPRFSPDGHWFSWVERSTLNLRYLNEPFVLKKPESETSEKNPDDPADLTLSLSGRYYSWAPDSQRIVLSKRTSNVLGGYPYYDLFIADLNPLIDLRTKYLKAFAEASTSDKRQRLTRRYKWKRQGMYIEPKRISKKLRATHVGWSPDGKWIAYARNRDGQRILRLVDPTGREHRNLVTIGGDAESIDPIWSPDSTHVAFTLFNHNQSDIWIVRVEDQTLTPITLDAADDRDPAFSPDGTRILFASDRSGLFQIYETNIDAKENTLRPVTQVETGAFMPFVDPRHSRLLYSRFSSFGFKIFELPDYEQNPLPAFPQPAFDAKIETHQLEAETVPALKESHSYFPWPRPVRIFPSFLYENDQFKAGVGFQVSDYLEKHRFSASVLFGREQDYQVSYYNHMWYPTFFGTYTAYIRTDGMPFISDGDDIQDEPDGVVRDNIQFVDAGISQTLKTTRVLPGSHKLSLAYDRRFVDRRIGFPLLINDEVSTSFRLLTNDGLTLSWHYSKTPSRPDRDFAINPRDATYVSAGYSLVHTSLFSPDTAISTPDQRYFHHEGTLSISRYFKMPWKEAWWDYHSCWIQFTGGVKSRDVTNLDEFFLGGRVNFRAFGQISSNTLFYGYEDFSIFGETLLLLSTGYTFPLARAIDKKTGFLYWDSVYASVFYEMGNAWSFGDYRNLNQNASRNSTLGQGEVFLYDVGAEIRLRAFLFTDRNEWNSILRVAYGFQDDANHGFSDDDSPVRVYVGIGTNF